MPWCTKHDDAWCRHAECVEWEERIREQQLRDRDEEQR